MTERKGTRALELWCKRLVKDCPQVQIENMTTSWRNGMAFCALVHHFRPDLIDMSTLKAENIYENNKLAFNIAEKHLGIPSLLDPEDMVENEVPDRLSILTYLSQFYQRLGHTVNTRTSESDNSVPSPQASSSSTSIAGMKFGKSLDKCVACGLPVYLAQRLIVAHKLYHRRCFRCSKCLGHLNPNSFKDFDGKEFVCDNCKNYNSPPRLANEAQMGMLAFDDDFDKKKDVTDVSERTSNTPKRKSSILDKINMFESNDERKSSNVRLQRLSLNEPINIMSTDDVDKKIEGTPQIVVGPLSIGTANHSIKQENKIDKVKDANVEAPEDLSENLYKSDKKKFSFLQTQLSDEKDDVESVAAAISELDINTNNNTVQCEQTSVDRNESVHMESNLTENNILDKTEEVFESTLPDNDILEKDEVFNSDLTENNVLDGKKDVSDIPVSVNIPPRRKKRVSDKPTDAECEPNEPKTQEQTLYPGHLNPFSDDEDEEEETVKNEKRVSTNPFGSSDEEDDEMPPLPPPPMNALSKTENNAPQRRLISANPFWSDGEEPFTDEDNADQGSMYNSSIASSTPNLRVSTPRRKKCKAPLPPLIAVTEHSSLPDTSIDGAASLSSMSSFNSTVNSDQKSFGKLTPRTKKRLAPTPPDSISTMSGSSRDLHGTSSSMDRGADTSLGYRRTKKPAPGLPLPERREVKLQVSPSELQVQLDMLETQQLGLERQGVLIEQMIRDKCEGDASTPAPQEEVEDLVIQLCELVNEKNDLFRKQTELMYIRRQQRLEIEQADIEHEIRVIQSKPAVNRNDGDKVREEELVSRLVEIVRQRDELVQQMDSERRRERQEDLAIAASIANKRAQRNSDSNSSSLKSEVVTPKKNKVKDKVKKQFKKAKHTLIPKKKDDHSEGKAGKLDKGKTGK